MLSTSHVLLTFLTFPGRPLPRLLVRIWNVPPLPRESSTLSWEDHHHMVLASVWKRAPTWEHGNQPRRGGGDPPYMSLWGTVPWSPTLRSPQTLPSQEGSRSYNHPSSPSASALSSVKEKRGYTGRLPLCLRDPWCSCVAHSTEGRHLIMVGYGLPFPSMLCASSV